MKLEVLLPSSPLLFRTSIGKSTHLAILAQSVAANVVWVQVRFLAFLSDPNAGSSKQTLTLMVRYGAAAALPAPLYEGTVERDGHPHLAAPSKARPPASVSADPTLVHVGGTFNSGMDRLWCG